MKKILPIAMLAFAAVAVSCSNDDDNGLKNPTKEAISFAKPYVQNSVLGRTQSNIDFDSFKVWGFVKNPDSYIFNGADVTSQDKISWTVTQTEYWYPDQKYYFSAVAPGKDISIAPDNTKAISFTPLQPQRENTYEGGGTIEFNNSTAKGQVDLVYAWKTEDTSKGIPTAVDLAFSHLLSRVRFSFINDVSDATKLIISELGFTGSYETGSIDLTGPVKDAVWQPSDVDFTISNIDITNEKFARRDTVASKYTCIIPAQDALSLSFKVTVYNGETQVKEYNHTVEIPSVDFMKGNSYNFTATLTSKNLNPDGELEPIKFNVIGVDGWGDDINNPIPVGK